MAFAFRKIISNIGYFKKTDDDENSSSNLHHALDAGNHQHKMQLDTGDAEIINFECTEPDSTSICNTVEFSTSLKLPETVKKFTTKKGSLSDTDLLTNKERKKEKKAKKLKLDIKKANQSLDESFNRNNLENTPTHVLLENKTSEIFSERMKRFDFSKSFELDSDSDVSSYEEEDVDIESFSDDISLMSDDQGSIKMCRKVSTESEASNDAPLVLSVSPESFTDVEIEKNGEERMALLLYYQMNFEKMECFLKNLLTKFQFHIEVTKIFNTKSFATLPGADVSNIPKQLADAMYVDNQHRGESPVGSWNIIMEKEDTVTKNKLKNQLLSIQGMLDNFIKSNLRNQDLLTGSRPPMLSKLHRSITYDVFKAKRTPKKSRTNNKKKMKLYDFPDIRDAMLKLFSTHSEASDITTISLEESEKCLCRCHEDFSSQTDSGLKMKTEDGSMSITSSIGNFSLDTSTLTAYSESLEQVISYSSFQDSSIYSSLLQKPAKERITFYIQAHSIQLKSEPSNDEYEMKNAITFDCPACKITEYDENDLLKHILSQSHCEKIHFLYKTAYIKKCVATGKEIQPSTVLNPMKMYRDENKIVCFGDATYACTLCFETGIKGESVLMAHCSDNDHAAIRDKLDMIME